MPAIKEVERQIFEREGFRARLTPFDPKTKSIPAYSYSAMAPQRWRISDWKMQRLSAYFEVIRKADVQRPDGTEVKGDLQLGNIRDAYYEAEYGPIKEPKAPTNVLPFVQRDRK